MFRKIMMVCLGSTLLIGIVVAFIIGGNFSMDKFGPRLRTLQVFAQQPPSLNPSTIVREENQYSCGDVEEVGRNTAASLNIKSEQDLKNKYQGAGYTVKETKDGIVVRHNIEDFCNYHLSFRHLGIKNNKLAVFQGPIGINHNLMKIEEKIPLESLSAAFQVKLQQAMNYSEMTPETQKKLKYELEFDHEDALNAVLENLDELQ